MNQQMAYARAANILLRGIAILSKSQGASAVKMLEYVDIKGKGVQCCRVISTQFALKSSL